MLTPGTRIGPYEIVGLLGRGGMGEVYRARDERLGRDVAIKVLPAELAASPDRLARFQREARLLAALNHANIGQIYGLEEADGIQALVLELIEGRTLAERTTLGPVSFDDALSLARQIAEALEAAHDRGIVHRDLKPANIVIDDAGTVKVLDFGLAKALVEDTSGQETLDQSPTVVAPTVAGTVVGTAAYMSPEQARGHTIDQRSDIWAFGCVLYELLCGRRTFAGDTVSDTIANVLRLEPDWSLLPAATPPSIRRLLRRCLAKDPRNRLHSIADARLEIDASEMQEVVSNVLVPAPRWRLARSAAALPWALAATAAVVATWLAVNRPSEKKVPAVVSVEQLTDQPNVVGSPSLSPDGDTLTFAAGEWPNTDVFVQRVGGRKAVNLTAECEEEDSMPEFSPDGEHIAFRSECFGGGLFVMGATGESLRRVTNFGFFPAWSPDGAKLVFAKQAQYDPMWQTGQSELWIADLASGATRRVLAGNATAPQWSPSGKWIAYESLAEGSNSDVWVIPASGLSESASPARVTSSSAGDFGPQWSADGRFLYFASDRMGAPNLWRVAFNESQGRTAGEPEPVTLPLPCGSFSSSRNGRRFAFTWSVEQSSVLRLDLDPVTGARRGAPRTILESARTFEQLSVSPDDRWIAGRLLPDRDIFVMRADGSGLRRLTQDRFDDQTPAWWPDGSALVFSSDRGNGYALWRIGVDGSGLRQLTADDTDCGGWPLFSPDGHRLASALTQACLWDVSASGELGALRKLPAPAKDHVFWPFFWAADGRLLMGSSVSVGGSISASSAQIVVLEPATGKFSRVPTLDGLMACFRLGSDARLACWSPSDGAVVATDLQSERRTVVLTAAETRDLRDWNPAPSGEWLCLVHNHRLREIWLAELQ